jgi:hypothetical protein
LAHRPASIETAGITIVIAEKEKWPHYLKEGDNVIFWDIPDPFGQADDFAEDVYKQSAT